MRPSQSTGYEPRSREQPWVYTHLNREAKGQDESSDHLKEIGPRSHPPKEEDLVWRLGKNWESQIRSDGSDSGHVLA